MNSTMVNIHADQEFPFRQVVKRDGSKVEFVADKILSAIRRAGEATEEFDGDEAGLLTSQVLKVMRHKFGAIPPQIEQIQDAVEQVLISANHFKTARAYIIYREQHQKLRRDRKTLVDVASSVNE
ncbi:MAG: ATP cone domain-containing protein, partial [Geobacteraceae bacterium]|nr:ATP cone domain-containing protein [Geobacteraceae bacterium]